MPRRFGVSAETRADLSVRREAVLFFESAAYAYRAQPALCLDRILVFNVKDMLPEQAEAAEIS